MASATSYSTLNMLTTEEVRAMKSNAPGLDRKQKFLQAIVGSVNVEGVLDLERRVRELAEFVDEAENHQP